MEGEPMSGSEAEVDEALSGQFPADAPHQAPAQEPAKPQQKSLSEMTDGELLQLPRSYVFETMLERCAALKELGNRRWKAGDVQGAAEAFEKAVNHGKMDEAQFMYELLEQHQESARQVVVPAITNFVLAKLRLYEAQQQQQQEKQQEQQEVANDKKVLEEVLEDLETVFVYQPDAPAKAHYLRGLAYEHMGKHDKALDELRLAAKKAPKDKNIRDLFEKVTALKKQEEKESNAIWKGKLMNEPATSTGSKSDEQKAEESKEQKKNEHREEPKSENARPPQPTPRNFSQSRGIPAWLFIVFTSVIFVFFGMFLSSRIPDPFRRGR